MDREIRTTTETVTKYTLTEADLCEAITDFLDHKGCGTVPVKPDDLDWDVGSESRYVEGVTVTKVTHS